MDCTNIGQLISQIGFPIVVAGFVLIRLEKRMDDLTAAIRDNTRNITATLRETDHFNGSTHSEPR